MRSQQNLLCQAVADLVVTLEAAEFSGLVNVQAYNHKGVPLPAYA